MTIQKRNISIEIRKSSKNDEIPYQLLLLADDTKEAIDKYLHEGELFLAERDARPVAAFVLKEMNSRIVEIKNIAVSRELQGNGIGTRMLEYIIDTIRSRGYAVLNVGTCDQCEKEISFYKKAGFRISSIRKNFFKENYKEPIYENGIQIIDMVVLSLYL